LLLQYQWLVLMGDAVASLAFPAVIAAVVAFAIVVL
jgi:hypothetical protein